jgi:hypothetical protein
MNSKIRDEVVSKIYNIKDNCDYLEISQLFLKYFINAQYSIKDTCMVEDIMDCRIKVKTAIQNIKNETWPGKCLGFAKKEYLDNEKLRKEEKQ